MKLRYKIGGSVLLCLFAAVGGIAMVISHTAECERTPGVSSGMDTVKAIVYRCYGPPEVLEYVDIEKPVPASDEVLIRVSAAAVNPLDWHYMRGSPYVMRLGTGLGKPKYTRIGTDFAGTVESAGADVTLFQPGDEVFGGANGAFSQYLTIREDRALTIKPANISFEQAAAIPIAAISALQALRDLGQLAAGDKVLINGASGGVGTYAVQIAKAFGAEVTGVCSTRNVEMVKSLGADQVFDYKKSDYTKSGQKFDLIVDMVGNHGLLANRKALAPDGKLVIVGGPSGDWLGPLAGPIKASMLSPFIDQEIELLMAQMRGDDLAVLAELMRQGKLKSVIDQRFELARVADAVSYSESGRARGKIIITMD
jgi:NADPH:quinone reductase-like Zn-dependent oxidoreductase